MRKKLSLFLVIILSVIMMCSLVACSNTPVSKDDLPNDIPKIDTENDDALYSLKFTSSFANSVFNGIEVSDFSIDKFNYSVVYKDANGDVIKEVPVGALSEDMVDSRDKEKFDKIKVSGGHENIRINATLSNGKTASGTLPLHIINSKKQNLVTLSFRTTPYNSADKRTISGATVAVSAGTLNSANNTIGVKIDQGAKFLNWQEFVSAFPMKLEGTTQYPYALHSVGFTSASGSVTLDYSNAAFPFTVDNSYTMATYWSQDTVSVTLDINFPKGAEDSPENYEGSEKPSEALNRSGLRTQTIARSVGLVRRPSDDIINKYYGYQLKGWYDKDTGKKFNFNQPVGTGNITLQAQWTTKIYSYTLYTKGGGFKESLEAAKTASGTAIQNAEQAEAANLHVVECISNFGLSTNDLNRITFTGMQYDWRFEDCVAPVTVAQEEEPVWMRVSDFVKADAANGVLTKGGDTLKIAGLYLEYQCANPLGEQNSAKDSYVAYVKWTYNAPEQDDDLERISKYIKDVMFSGGVVVNEDGSITLSRASDSFADEIIIPTEIKYEDQVRPITAIGDGACMNLKALTVVNMENASNLTSIGAKAFNYCRALTTVTMPKDMHISSVGVDAFGVTNFEENYIDGDQKYLIINNMLYKYTGKENDGTELDLTVLESRPTKVTAILEDAFADSAWITKVKLSKDIERIEKGAFKGLADLNEIEAPADSALVYIGEGAFADSGIVGRSSKNYDATTTSIIVGGIYYLFMGAANTVESAKVPGEFGGHTIEYIAEGAFKNMPNLYTLSFDDETNIKGVGKDAFAGDRRFLEKATDGYTVINGILAAFYSEDVNNKNLVLPVEVKTIGEHAFGSYSLNVETIELHSQVERIENYAFAGARSSSLRGILLSSIAVDEDGTTLTGAPTIGANSFSNSDGKLMPGLMFYVRKDVFDLLQNIAEGNKTSEDAVTNSWAELYKIYSANFAIEDISSVIIDEAIISKVLLRETDNAWKDAYGEGDVVDALIVVSNTGIRRRASLGLTSNNIQFEEITQDGPYAEFYTDDKAVKRYVVKFEYFGVQYPKDVSSAFILTACDDIHTYQNGSEVKFYSLDVSGYSDRLSRESIPITTARLSEEGGRNMWFTGLTPTVEGDTIAYWRSDEPFNVTFKYKDINGEIRQIGSDAITITGLQRTNTASHQNAIIRVNFHGIGTLRFTLNYEVRIPQYTELLQTGPISIPLNATASTYFAQKDYKLKLKLEDGSEEDVPFNTERFYIMSPIETGVLGMHSVQVSFNENNVGLTLTVYYTVVLEADESQFTFGTTNKPIMSGEEKLYDGEATILSCSARYAATIVIPGAYHVKRDGIDYVYKVTRLGEVNGTKGVFEDFVYLQSVYLSSNLEYIGANTFRGCVALSSVNTAQESTAADVALTSKNIEEIEDLDPVSENGKQIYFAKLINLEGVTCEELYDDEDNVDRYTLPIGSTYDIDGKTYRIVAIAGDLPIDAPHVTGKTIYVYLPDSIYMFDGTPNITSVGSVVSVSYYSSDSPRFRVFERTNLALKFIGATAFENCVSLRTIDLTESASLSYIGPGAFTGAGLVRINLSHNKLLKVVEGGTFRACENLATVVLHENFETFASSAFRDCYSLSRIVVYKGEDYENAFGVEELRSLKYIGDGAFANCKSLTSFTLDKTVQSIGNGAFSGCTALTIYLTFPENELPDGTKWVYGWVGDGVPMVYNCATNDTASDQNIYYVFEGVRYALHKATHTATVVAQSYATAQEISIPDKVSYKEDVYTVTEIGESAFSGNKFITKIIVSKELNTIGRYAFANCVNLVVFLFKDDNGLTSVSSNAFDGCTSLQTVPGIKSVD